MFKFEISDEALLRASSAAAAAFALKLGLAPRFSHDSFFRAASAQPYNEVVMRYVSVGVGGAAATGAGVAATEVCAAAKRNALKAMGCMWLAAAAMDGYYVSQGVARRDYAVPAASLTAVLGAVCLWRGLRKAGAGAS